MARYRRPRALSQRNDPSEPHVAHENNNCTMVSGAMALDYHTAGLIRKRGGDLRHKQLDQVGGTDLSDVAYAWRKYGQTLAIAQGWAGIRTRLGEGRCIILQGDSGDLDNSCSESQDVAHAVLVHPDTHSSGAWLIADPWCYVAGSNGLGKWQWLVREDVYRYAAKLGFRFAYTRRQPKIA